MTFLSKAKANYRNDLAAGYESFFHRPDLHVNSLLFPYAITKEILDAITPESLLNPILAQMKIIKNKFRISNHFKISIPQIPSFPSKQLIRYHLEAIENWVNILQNSRGNYTDNNRRRDIILELQNGEQRAIPKIITGKSFIQILMEINNYPSLSLFKMKK